MHASANPRSVGLCLDRLIVANYLIYNERRHTTNVTPSLMFLHSIGSFLPYSASGLKRPL